MQGNDIFFIVRFWITLFLIGILFFPLTALLFEKFVDKGYVFSKILGLIILSYVLLIGGILHVIPFSTASCFLLLLGVLIVVFFRAFSFKTHQVSFTIAPLLLIKKFFKVIVFEELLFLGAFLLWAFVRGTSPDIHGLEKYMDYGFVNSLLRSTYFPPKDMWFSPYNINYYYFGHLTTAVLTKLSGVPSNISFNLMIATIFAFCISCSFSLGTNLFCTLKKTTRVLGLPILGGFIAALLVSLAGNLHTIYTLFKPYQNENPVPFWHLPLSLSTFPNAYWYPNATRYIYHTIHEFPIYSFVVADLHGHVLAIPFVLLTLATVLHLFLVQDTYTAYLARLKVTTPLFKQVEVALMAWKTPILLLSFLLAILYMTNSFDGITYFLLSALSISTIHFIWKREQKGKSIKDFSFFPSIILVSIALAAVIFSLPFSLSFKPFVSGIGVLCAPSFLTHIGKLGPFLFEADHCQHSPWWQLLVLYGFFYFWAISLLLFLWKRKKQVTDIFAFVLIIVSTILIILPEFIYFKDIYPAHYRANTMFKFVYQSFIMLSLVSSYSIIRIALGIRPKLFRKKSSFLLLPWFVLAAFLIFLVSIYPYFATFSYYNNLKLYQGLDGTKYLKNLYPTDYAGIQWLQTHIKGQPVILEAQGDSYTDYARISANTGLPTVLGWTVHEWLWRGTYDIPAPRITEVKTLYETTDQGATTSLLKKYNVTLVFVGDLERQKYPGLNEEKFARLGKLVYQNGTTHIYEIAALR